MRVGPMLSQALNNHPPLAMVDKLVCFEDLALVERRQTNDVDLSCLVVQTQPLKRAKNVTKEY